MNPFSFCKKKGVSSPKRKTLMRRRKIISEIAFSLGYYANRFANLGTFSKEDNDEASEMLRKLANELTQRTIVIPLYGLFEHCDFVRKKSDIRQASKELIEISNSIHQGNVNPFLSNIESRKKIEKLLGFEDLHN
jgi:hypothetical protein